MNLSPWTPCHLHSARSFGFVPGHEHRHETSVPNCCISGNLSNEALPRRGGLYVTPICSLKSRYPPPPTEVFIASFFIASFFMLFLFSSLCCCQEASGRAVGPPIGKKLYVVKKRGTE